MRYYLIETTKSNEGFVLFWKGEGKGYSIDMDEAGVFSYDDAKDYLIGKTEKTVAIEKHKFEMMMKTSKIVWNFSDFYNLFHGAKPSSSTEKLEEKEK